MKAALVTALAAAALAGCPSPPETMTKWPAQKEGCAVQTFPDRPQYNVDNIGPVSATCDESIADADCLRVLMDQACKIGGDTVWGVEDKPELKNGKKWFSGRAAHRK